jgi:hypothetical protein
MVPNCQYHLIQVHPFVKKREIIIQLDLDDTFGINKAIIKNHLSTRLKNYKDYKTKRYNKESNANPIC